MTASEKMAMLNEVWKYGGACCKLPCQDPICREDMNYNGGCPGADFADALTAHENSKVAHCEQCEVLGLCPGMDNDCDSLQSHESSDTVEVDRDRISPEGIIAFMDDWMGSGSMNRKTAEKLSAYLQRREEKE